MSAGFPCPELPEESQLCVPGEINPGCSTTTPRNSANYLMRFSRKVLSYGVASLLVLVGLTTRASAQAPLFFDGFLADNGGMPANDFNAFFLWSVTNGSVDLAGGNMPGVDDPAMGGRYVDLAGSSGTPGVFSTRAPLVFMAGTLYNLSFRYANTGGSMNQAAVTLGLQMFTVTATSPTFLNFSQNFSFISNTSANLIFQDLGIGSDDFGVGIDDVMVSQVVPEPATAALLFAGGAGLLLSGLGLRRRSESYAR